MKRLSEITKFLLKGLRNFKWSSKKYVLLIIPVLCYLWWPVEITTAPTSTVINDQHGNLLSASVADDDQWRFPEIDSVPYKIETCILLFEDEYFHYHPGINPLSLVRALYQNLRAGKVVSGASTITMQIARMMRKQDRTIFQKTTEMALALRLEFNYTKDELITHYVSMAPFGGNVVGIEAASWRYYGRPPHLLSWAEAATLAVLPNQPGAVYPGKSNSPLKAKRDFLLQKLYQKQVIDSLTCQLSLDEPLPGNPYSIPQKAPHLLTTFRKDHEGRQVTTTLASFWQSKTNEIISRKHGVLKTNGVENLAAMVVDLESGNVLAYVGNTTDPQADACQVDIIQSPRSSGSILKPLLYAKALDEGLILPESLLPDIPSFFGGYTPKNFNHGYEGAVHADKALMRSLNIPFAHLLKDYKYEKFHQDLQKLGFTTLKDDPGHYGLSLILGGAEVTLWDLAQAYFSLYRKLANEDNMKIRLSGPVDKLNDADMEEINIWHTFQAMTRLSRPGINKNWENFNSTQKIAWKTGTSFGFRDAWAVGLNGKILVAVWVGNADGEGRAGLSGATSAGPILNELVRLSDYGPNWLDALFPFAETKSVCIQSGRLASTYCPDTKYIPAGKKAELAGLCPFHKLYWLDKSNTYLVNRSCYPSAITVEKPLFVLPPTWGYYYKKNHSDYPGRPSAFPGCETQENAIMNITYPVANTKIFIPKELSGLYGEVVLEASHQDPDAELFWHINDTYMGKSRGEHKQSLKLDKGIYQILLLDQHGNSITRSFEVVSEQ